MLRSPILVLVLLLSIVSCQKNVKTSIDTSKKQESPKKVIAQKYSELGDSFSRDNNYQ